jgi:hypothetical protein
MKQCLSVLLFFISIMAFSQPAEVISNPKLKKRCVKPAKTFKIDGKIPEGSGLAAWNGSLCTHNDSGAARLFSLDTISGAIIDTYELPDIVNTDWEDLGQDDDYFYLGDIGNNLNDKNVLTIYRIEKKSLLQHRPKINTIAFSWPETDTAGKTAKINFDCEAMTVVSDSIYLFTKEWKKTHRTRVFSIPKSPGTYVAKYKNTLKTRLLVTGASYDTSQKSLVLCGYNLWLRPFLLRFKDVKPDNFFSGKGEKIKIRKRFRQTEGVASFDGKTYFVINEDFHFLFLHSDEEIHRLELKKN